MNTTFAITAIVIVFFICTTVIITNWRSNELGDKITNAKNEARKAYDNEQFFRNLYYSRAGDFISALNNNVLLVTKDTFDKLTEILDKMQEAKED